MISDWKEVSLPDNNIRNFMSDWNLARKLHKKDNSAHITSLNIEYYFDEEKEVDYIINKDGSITPLISASSGIQSYVPLYILVDYFTDWIYKNEEPESVTSQEKKLRIFSKIRENIFSEFDLKEQTFDNILTKNVKNFNKKESTIILRFLDKFQCFLKNNSTKLYIEEPELNLFPSIQRKVIYFLLKSIKNRPDDSIILTTHSPYILYALNNCLMGGIIKNNIPKDMAESIESHDSWIDPHTLSAWQIQEGTLLSIQDEQTKSIEKHYFNEIMNETMDEYYTMLNFLDTSSYDK